MSDIAFNHKRNPSMFFKTLFSSLLLSIILTLSLSLIISVLLGKIPKYESFYPFVTVLILFIPNFFGTRRTVMKSDHFLIFIGLLQALLFSLILLIASLVLSRGEFNLNLYISSLIYIFSSSVFASVLPKTKKKKIRI
ncbi:MAG: TIGR04086 family membrane protein [Ruminococcaceae bacterium]|nr:TIGR04086 family membrane protein [Oscillospiraceae bacterium]